MQHIFIWDSSTSRVFLQTRGPLGQIQIIRKYEKRVFGLEFPQLFAQIEGETGLKSDCEVLLGAGPGSFTGIKTGVSFIGSWLYGKGITKVKLVSSLDLLSLFTPYYEDTIHFVLAPFNVSQIFVTIFKWEKGTRCYLERDKLLTPQALSALMSRMNYDAVIVCALDTLPEYISDLFNKSFRHVLAFDVAGVYNLDMADRIPVLQQVELGRDPLLLNYVSAPANIDGDGRSFYIAMN